MSDRLKKKSIFSNNGIIIRIINVSAVGAPCNADSDCTEGAQCVYGNNTLPGKRCYCKEGYFEDNKMCNGKQ